MNAAPSTRIVLATRGSPGDLFPFLAIGMELRRRDHDVVVAASERYRDKVVAAGLGFAAVRPDRIAGQAEPDFLDRLWRDRQRPERVFREMFFPALRESLEDLLGVVAGAGVVVSHTLTPAAPLAAEALGVPWVSAVMQPMGYISAHEPPVLGAQWVAASLRASGPRMAAPILGVAHRVTASWMGEWHAIRREIGLPPVATHPLWEGQHGRISLGLFPHLLGEPQPDWPRQARVTGFPFHRPPHSALDPGIDAFLSGGEPPIIFTLGTTAVNDPGTFFEESAEAAIRLGIRALLLVGDRRQDGEAVVADDVFAAPYAPHHLLFPRAAAIVHQGGIGTLSEVLLAGKPMLIVPYAHDQFDNAWRAERLGVAHRISRRRYRASAVSRALARLLDAPRAPHAARLAGRAMARDRGAAKAADLIETVLRGC